MATQTVEDIDIKALRQRCGEIASTQGQIRGEKATFIGALVYDGERELELK